LASVKWNYHKSKIGVVFLANIWRSYQFKATIENDILSMTKPKLKQANFVFSVLGVCPKFKSLKPDHFVLLGLQRLDKMVCHDAVLLLSFEYL
jgi:hypothetical protein